MDFDFSDDQVALREAVARYVEKAYGFERRRAIEREGGFSAQVWAELIELGLPGLNTDVAHGGMGMSAVDGMVVLEELGRGLVVEPIAQSFIASALIERFGDATLKDQWLPLLASGEVKAGFALHERATRYALQKIEGKCHYAGTGYELSATKIVVNCAQGAELFVVSALLDGVPALFLVTPGGGVYIEPEVDWAGAASGMVHLAQAPAQLLARDGAAALDFVRDWGVATTCAYAVGAMERTFALTVDYMNTRQQFGVSLSSFQALRHRVADMKMQLELARGMSYYATLKLGDGDAERTQACSRAKVQLGQAMRAVSQGAVQLHGGIGVTDEVPVSHYFRVLTALDMQWGDAMHHLGEVSARMTDQAGVFA
jgi:alkylation response protein AidB-like acyl-CoA dehydrogenase